MTRDPFLRLALIALVAGFVVVLFVVARELGVVTAVCAAAVGVAGALVLSIEHDPGRGDALAQLQARARHARRFRTGPAE